MNMQNILAKIKNENRDSDYTIEIVSSELVSICPIINLPDFYTVRIMRGVQNLSSLIK